MRFLPYNNKLNDRARELRKNMTESEKKIWQFLRKLPYSVLRQRVIDNFIVDFYCAHLKLVIEIDGESHFTEEGIGYDKERTEILEGYGIKVIRFSNNEVINNFEIVCEKILMMIRDKLPLAGKSDIT